MSLVSMLLISSLARSRLNRNLKNFCKFFLGDKSLSLPFSLSRECLKTRAARKCR